MSDDFTLLITDRNRHVRNFLRRELIAEGYQVEVAADGRDLLRKISLAGPPDLLILDLEIPPLGGAALLRKIQRQHLHSSRAILCRNRGSAPNAPGRGKGSRWVQEDLLPLYTPQTQDREAAGRRHSLRRKSKNETGAALPEEQKG